MLTFFFFFLGFLSILDICNHLGYYYFITTALNNSVVVMENHVLRGLFNYDILLPGPFISKKFPWRMFCSKLYFSEIFFMWQRYCIFLVFIVFISFRLLILRSIIAFVVPFHQGGSQYSII